MRNMKKKGGRKDFAVQLLSWRNGFSLWISTTATSKVRRMSICISGVIGNSKHREFAVVVKNT